MQFRLSVLLPNDNGPCKLPVILEELVIREPPRNRCGGTWRLDGWIETHELPRIVSISLQAVSNKRKEVSFGYINGTSANKLGRQEFW